MGSPLQRARLITPEDNDREDAVSLEDISLDEQLLDSIEYNSA